MKLEIKGEMDDGVSAERKSAVSHRVVKRKNVLGYVIYSTVRMYGMHACAETGLFVSLSAFIQCQ